MSKPIYECFDLKHGAISFESIDEKRYLDDLKKSVELAKLKIEAIVNDSAPPSFANTIEALEFASEEYTRVSTTFWSLFSANRSEYMTEIAGQVSSIGSEFGNDIRLNSELFEKVNQVYQNMPEDLSIEQKTLLTQTYRDFANNGALLNEEGKQTLREYDTRLGELGVKFSDNVLKATNSFQLVLEKKDLEGLPEGLVAQAKELAESEKKSGSYIFTLQYPSFIPFMKYSSRRDLREKMYRAFSSKAYGGELDNSKIVFETASLRKKRAQLLGKDSHAEQTLQERMAQTGKNVLEFLEDILEKATPKAKQQMQELTSLAKQRDGVDDFSAWDQAFYTEILRKRQLDFDDEVLKPYFQLERVIDGVFSIASRLYNLRFEPADDSIQKYHQDVKIFEVYDREDSSFIGLFYCDFFPRSSKQGGAWMMNFKEQGGRAGMKDRPHVAIVCNFTKPHGDTPSLLNLDEVLTLFHEFGHALHGLLSRCQYSSVGGTNVYWDFVELPSQIMENWALEPECLKDFAIHHETGVSIPEALVKKIQASRQFLEGVATLRQLSFGFLDMMWHGENPPTEGNIEKIEEQAMEKCLLLPRPEGATQSCSFGHLFSGGYAAGYYSYKWAEVLDADAFSVFQEKGIFDLETAVSFKKNILEKGGSEHPSILYRKFRGSDPTSDALLRRAGLDGSELVS